MMGIREKRERAEASPGYEDTHLSTPSHWQWLAVAACWWFAMCQRKTHPVTPTECPHFMLFCTVVTVVGVVLPTVGMVRKSEAAGLLGLAVIAGTLSAVLWIVVYVWDPGDNRDNHDQRVYVAWAARFLVLCAVWCVRVLVLRRSTGRDAANMDRYVWTGFVATSSLWVGRQSATGDLFLFGRRIPTVCHLCLLAAGLLAIFGTWANYVTPQLMAPAAEIVRDDVVLRCFEGDGVRGICYLKVPRPTLFFLLGEQYCSVLALVPVNLAVNGLVYLAGKTGSPFGVLAVTFSACMLVGGSCVVIDVLETANTSPPAALVSLACLLASGAFVYLASVRLYKAPVRSQTVV